MSEENQNVIHSIEIGRKVDFYFIALVFTILSLSIQTAPVNKVWWQYSIEMLAWASLLVSGLAGLSRLEYIPVLYNGSGFIQKKEEYLTQLKQRRIIGEDGNELSHEEVLKRMSQVKETMADGRSKMERVEKANQIKYTVHKWAFVVGLLFLIISRAISKF